MKIIVNRGLNNIFTRIIVTNNTKEITSCPTSKDYCEFDAKIGESFFVKLRNPNTSTFTIASIDCKGLNDTFYICPTRLFKNWILVNYMILPGICLLFYILQKATVSDFYDLFLAGSMALWALSLICIEFCQYVPFMRKKQFNIIKI